MVNTSALESRGRGFKSRSRQFLEFHLCSFISFFHWFQFICVIYIYIYIYTHTHGHCPCSSQCGRRKTRGLAVFLGVRSLLGQSLGYPVVSTKKSSPLHFWAPGWPGAGLRVVVVAVVVFLFSNRFFVRGSCMGHWPVLFPHPSPLLI